MLSQVRSEELGQESEKLYGATGRYAPIIKDRGACRFSSCVVNLVYNFIRHIVIFHSLLSSIISSAPSNGLSERPACNKLDRKSQASAHSHIHRPGTGVTLDLLPRNLPPSSYQYSECTSSSNASKMLNTFSKSCTCASLYGSLPCR